MVRFGFMGTNWITDAFIDGAQQVDGFVVQAVYSRTEDKAKVFADKHGAKSTFTDMEAFAKSEEIDAVYIASPNALHKEQAILCMENGKHVIVEKAMASNTREMKEMIQTAKDNGVLLMEALKTTHMPNFEAIQNNLDKIGTVRRYFASYCQYSSRYDAYKEGTVLNAFKPEFSNGSLMDIGIYCVYPMIKLFGKPSSLKANSYMLESGVDGQGSIIFDYKEQGINGIVMYSKISNSYLPSEIQGEKGSIIIDNINHPQHVEIKYKDGTTETLTQEQNDNSMYYEAKHFIELINSEKVESDVNTYQTSLINAEVLEEARKQIGLVFPADQQ